MCLIQLQCVRKYERAFTGVSKKWQNVSVLNKSYPKNVVEGLKYDLPNFFSNELVVKNKWRCGNTKLFFTEVPLS